MLCSARLRRVPGNRAVVGVVMQDRQAVVSGGRGDDEVYSRGAAVLTRARHLLLNAEIHRPAAFGTATAEMVAEFGNQLGARVLALNQLQPEPLLVSGRVHPTFHDVLCG